MILLDKAIYKKKYFYYKNFCANIKLELTIIIMPRAFNYTINNFVY